MNGEIGGARVPQVRFKKASSADGSSSMSSMETLTTPLSADLSRDVAEDLFNATKANIAHNRTISGGMI